MNRFVRAGTALSCGGMLLSLFFVITLFPGCMYISGKGLLDLGPKPLREVVVSGEGRDKILIIGVSGVIEEEDRGGLLRLRGERSTVGLVKEQLEKAARDERVKGLLLMVNSPGGTVAASDIIYKEIKDFKTKEEIPVASFFMGTAASGAYYISQAADRIIASPATITGSIGVILLNINMTGLMEKVGVSDASVKTGALKDLGSPLRPPSPSDKQVLQGIADGFFARFCQVIEENRPGLKISARPEIADGRVFTAQQALDKELIDQVGYLPDAIDWLKKASGIPEAQVIRYAPAGEYVPSVYAMAKGTGAPGGDLNLIKFDVQGLFADSGPVFMYLWRPEL